MVATERNIERRESARERTMLTQNRSDISVTIIACYGCSSSFACLWLNNAYRHTFVFLWEGKRGERERKKKKTSLIFYYSRPRFSLPFILYVCVCVRRFSLFLLPPWREETTTMTTTTTKKKKKKNGNPHVFFLRFSLKWSYAVRIRREKNYQRFLSYSLIARQRWISIECRRTSK